jgi:hypothetical protein
MLLRAVQEALIAGAVTGETLTGLDDHSLLATLLEPGMPEPTRRLVAALRDRQLHKRAVEISSRAAAIFAELSRFFFDPALRRRIELAMVKRLSEQTGESVPEEAILIDIPKPERWRTEVWVQFDQPPVGFAPLMPWRDVVGLTDEDFKRFEERRRLIRIVAAEPWRDAVRASWETLLLPSIGLPL